MRMRLGVGIVAAVGLAATATACGGGPGSDTSSDSAQKTSRAPASYSAMDASIKGPAPQISGAKKGGTLTITDDGGPPTFDPSGAYYEFSMATLTGLALRTLTGYQIKDGKSTLVPDLATNLGTASPDGLTWTFPLKQGMKYSNGAAIKAQDFVYAVKRSFAYESVAENGPTYFQTYLVGGASYKGPYVQPTADFKGVTAPDDHTLVFHLTRKWPTLPYFASFPQVSPIPQSADTRTAYQTKPLAEGPYKVARFVKGRSFTLEKNPDWDAKSDPIRHQFPDRIEVQLGGSALTNQQRILSNTGAGATSIDTSGVDASLANKVTTSQKSQYVSGPSPCEQYMPINTATVPLQVRKAIAVAYPYDQIRKAQGDSPIAYTPATTFAPPQVPGIAKYPPVNALTGKGTGNPTEAKRLLQQAGKTGFALKYFFSNDDPQLVAANTAMKSGLEQAGFKVTDIGVTTDQLSERITDEKSDANLGQGLRSWCYDWPSGDSIYPQLFTSANAAMGRSVGNLRLPALDRSIQQIADLSPTQAAAKWGALDRQMASQYLPGLVRSYVTASYVFGKRVHSVTNDSNHGLPDFAQLWIG